MNIFSEKGQTLIEVLTALATATVVIAAITVATITALNNAQFSRDQSQANQYAQQGMEVMDNLRNYSIASISASALPDSYTYCLADGCTYITSDSTDTKCGPAQAARCSQNVGKFVREVQVNHADTSCNYLTTGAVKASVLVMWNDGACTDAANLFCHQVKLATCLSDFTIVPTP